jgi:hypothetical protein
MTALLAARPVFAAILLALVGVYAWTACRAEATDEPDAKRQPDAERRQ